MEQENKEIQELKEELAALHARIDRQAEISDGMIRKALDARIGHLQVLGSRKFRFCLIAAVFVVTLVVLQGTRLPFIVATAAFMALNAAGAYYLKKKENELEGASDLKGTMTNLVSYKRFNRNTTLIAVPLAIAWAVWYVYEIALHLGMTGKDVYGLIVACAVGGVIGGLIGYFTFYRPSMEEADKIINEIEDLK